MGNLGDPPSPSTPQVRLKILGDGVHGVISLAKWKCLLREGDCDTLSLIFRRGATPGSLLNTERLSARGLCFLPDGFFGIFTTSAARILPPKMERSEATDWTS